MTSFRSENRFPARPDGIFLIIIQNSNLVVDFPVCTIPSEEVREGTQAHVIDTYSVFPMDESCLAHSSAYFTYGHVQVRIGRKEANRAAQHVTVDKLRNVQVDDDGDNDHARSPLPDRGSGSKMIIARF